MRERVILADCCEDWIIEWGGFYGDGSEFRCPECATEWTKLRAGAFRRGDGREFERRERNPVPGAAFPYLAAADGDEPDVERCCAKILLTHGAQMTDGPFTCPVCSTEWTRGTARVHGLHVPAFSKHGLRSPLTIQAGRNRPFLVAVTAYSPPRE